MGQTAKGEQTSGPVLIADGDEAFVARVQRLLESGGYRTLTAMTGEEALRIARQENPRVVLLEIELPAPSGFQVCRVLRDEFKHEVAIAFLSCVRTESVDIAAGLLFGADDYVVKPFSADELLARVRRRLPGPPEESSEASDLTKRELQVLRLLSAGLSQKEIAADLVISSKTVGAHVQHVLGKLGVHSRTQAVAQAYRRGLLNGFAANGDAAAQ